MADDKGLDFEAGARWDVVQGLRSWRLWAFMGLMDIRQRYRRSLIGPLWLAMGLGVTVAGIGLLYTQVLGVSAEEYLPFLAISLWIWSFMTSCLTEGTSLFSSAGHIITTVRIPYTTFVLRSLVRNLIVAAHGLIVVIGVFIFYGVPIGLTSLLSILGVILIIVNLYWMVLVISMMSARFQDAAQIFIYVINLALFLTPVIWMPSQVRPGSPFLLYNPLAQMLEAVRGPILNGEIPGFSLAYLAVMAAVGLPVTLIAFQRLRRHVPYWI